MFIEHLLHAWHCVEYEDKMVTDTGMFPVLMKLRKEYRAINRQHHVVSPRGETETYWEVGRRGGWGSQTYGVMEGELTVSGEHTMQHTDDALYHRSPSVRLHACYYHVK